MKKAHKIRMNPTAEQVEYLKRACGTRRFVYNWGREHWEAEYQAYKAEQETIPEAERKLQSPNAMARAVADAAMGQLLTFLKNKMSSAGGQVFMASRWFPSTKRCSGCGHVKMRMPLKHRTYQCLACGLVIDRDLNAALNLAQFALEKLRQLA